MSHHERYREHRIRGSLERHIATTEGEERVHQLASAAWQKRGSVLFTEADLAAMPWPSRSLIESEARRIYGRRGGR